MLNLKIDSGYQTEQVMIISDPQLLNSNFDTTLSVTIFLEQ